MQADTRYVAECETETVPYVQSGQIVDTWSIVQSPSTAAWRSASPATSPSVTTSPVDPTRFTVADSVATIDLAGQHMTKFGITSSVATDLLRHTLSGLVIDRHIDVHAGGDYRDGSYQQTGDVIQVFEGATTPSSPRWTPT